MGEHLAEKAAEKTLYRLGIAAALLAAAIAVWGRGVPWERLFSGLLCPFRRVAGLYCPGCGGTRAVKALLEGRLLESLWLHPLVPYGAALYLAFMGSQTLRLLWGALFPSGRRFPALRWRDGYLWGALALLALNWAVKNGLLWLGQTPL